MRKTAIATMLLMLIAFVGVVSAAPVNITEVEIEDTILNPDDVNSLAVTRDEKFEVRVELLGLTDSDNLELRAFISGYEFNTEPEEALTASTGTFKVQENKTYVKKLYLMLPEEVEEDNYKLRLLVSDRNNDELLLNYNLFIEPERHNLKIKDVLLFPYNKVTAGDDLLITVRLDNKGQKDERNVKVTASLLGLSNFDYVEEVEVGDEEETEEIYLKLPKCAEPGTYDLEVKAEYNYLRDSTKKLVPLSVLENPDCEKESEEVVVVKETSPEPTQPSETIEETAPKKKVTTSIRKLLETLLLILVGVLVIVGLIIGFSRLGSEE